VGAELVSLSAVLTLAGAGIEVAAMVTEHPTHQIFFPFSAALWYAVQRLGVQVIPRTNVSRILGQRRVEAIETKNIVNGELHTLACDTVIFSGKWTPEHELARSGGLLLDPATRGPRVDTALRTSTPGVFAAGNLLRGAQTADHAALEGRFAAQSIARFLDEPGWPQSNILIEVKAPIQWMTPNWLSLVSTPAKLPFVFQVDCFCRNTQLHITQGMRALFAQRVGNLIPNRPYFLPHQWLPNVDLGGEPLTVWLESKPSR
jgi:hypothetical protein